MGTGILRIRALAHLIAAVDRSKAEPDPPHDRPSVPDAPAGSTQKGVASETPEKPRFDIADAMANRERACERVRHLTRHLGATDPSDERDAVERNPTAAGENPAHIPPRADRVKKRAKGRFFPAGSQTLKVTHTRPSRVDSHARPPDHPPGADQKIRLAPGGGAGTLTVTDNRTGKRYEVPVTDDGFVSATAFKAIKAGGDGNGLKLYDPGYMNTAPCKSKISYIDGDKGILRYRGYPIEELAERSTYLEVSRAERTPNHPHSLATKDEQATTNPR